MPKAVKTTTKKEKGKAKQAAPNPEADTEASGLNNTLAQLQQIAFLAAQTQRSEPVSSVYYDQDGNLQNHHHTQRSDHTTSQYAANTYTDRHSTIHFTGHPTSGDISPKKRVHAGSITSAFVADAPDGNRARLGSITTPLPPSTSLQVQDQSSFNNASSPPFFVGPNATHRSGDFPRLQMPTPSPSEPALDPFVTPKRRLLTQGHATPSHQHPASTPFLSQLGDPDLPLPFYATLCDRKEGIAAVWEELGSPDGVDVTRFVLAWGLCQYPDCTRIFTEDHLNDRHFGAAECEKSALRSGFTSRRQHHVAF